MNTLHGLPILEHHKQLLKTGKQQHAWAIISEVIESFGVDGAKDCA